jgi:LysM repeat protein/lipoprotein-anchoring transpeptidase ErfK/SrfK
MVVKISFVLRLCPLLLLATTRAQDAEAPLPPPATVEAGLEQAVKWKWQVEPGDAGAWALAAATPAPGVSATEVKAAEIPKPAPRTAPEKALDHTVAKGETLTVIARRYVVTVDHIKNFNSLKNDIIRIGQVIRIPGIEDIKAMMPPAPPKDEKGDATSSTSKPPATAQPTVMIAKKPKRALPGAAWGAAALVQTQVFLDRQGFTIGPIDGTTGPVYDAAFQAHEKAHPGQLFTPDGQPSEAMKAIGGAYTEYELRPDDLRWIAPMPEERSRKKAATPPAVTLTDLTSQGFLAYRSGWEFVAERFHASEAFLRRINPHIKSPNTPGTTFLVPNVVPFEIENALAEPLQPAADPAQPIKASIVELKRLIIRRGEEVIASMPISVARPGLRGRGTWKVLDIIPHPRFTSTGDPAAPSANPLVLAPGPNNPAGIAWINLAKVTDPKPLPYGLHGTSIPGYMMKQESIGGFRLTNWDLARVIRLLPQGTDLTWE